LAVGDAALKNASRRARARWPRENEAILDRGIARRQGIFRRGQENGFQAKPENVDVFAGGRMIGDSDRWMSSRHRDWLFLALAVTG
jgi:hypothetical protein